MESVGSELAIAVSGSLSPCPVKVSTRRSRGRSRPLAPSRSAPASEIAEAGSANTPSVRARRRYAARMSSSLIASIAPPDSSRAASAACQLAGLPMRMAVATVRGSSITLPRTMGAAPIVLGRVIDEPRTVATAIRIGNPASWQAAEAARDESGGAIEAISDDDILAAYRLLARTEGVFAEPASAISLAGALRLGASGRLRPRDLLVLTLTGHGLKDPDTAIANSEPTLSIPPDLARLAAVLELD